MGVDRYDYLMVGVDLGMDFVRGNDGFYDQFQAEFEGAPDRRFDIVYDGMCGQYCIVGKIIASASDPYVGFEMQQVDLAQIYVHDPELAMAISEATGKSVTASDLKLLLFSHFA